MKTGIIVYSHTGHTKQAAELLLDSLRTRGRDCELLEVKVSNPKPEANASRIQWTNKPDVEAFDQVVFASPVWGFSLSGVMKAYLESLSSLKGKKVSLFVTHQLPLPWMGGNAAVRQMKKICEDLGGQISAHAVVSWGEKRREQDLAAMVSRLS